MTDSLIAPSARARLVVTMPQEPSRIASSLAKHAEASFTALTNTQDAFIHLARRAKDRLVVMTPFIDVSGASWAGDLFEATNAPNKTLIVRDAAQLDACGTQGTRLKALSSNVWDYAFYDSGDNSQTQLETFHAKIVLADGAAAYVGSANFLHRSREHNLECGFLLDGDAVAPVSILIDAVLAMFSE
ncbi:MAG: hypothetical protein DHS20C05_23400 [Hyphococcus sp.]|nr:MAG: hypothetical protein DHS20C05_23400 [Marinicaulis sp.]